MHRFQHGIRLAFLRPVGACFGFLLQQENDHDDDGALLPKLKGEEEGTLPPMQSGDHEADNADLQAHYKGHKEERQLPPMQSGEEEEDAGEGLLLPSLGEKDAVNTDLQQPYKGDLLPLSGEEGHEDPGEGYLRPSHGEEEKTAVQINLLLGQGAQTKEAPSEPTFLLQISNNLLFPLSGEEVGYLRLPTSKGDDGTVINGLQPTKEGHHDKGILSPTQRGEDGAVNHLHKQKEGNFQPANAAQNYDGISINNNKHQIWYVNVQISINNASNAKIGGFKATFYCAIHSWLMPSPRPRVKMKDDMKWNDTHAWKHDAWASSSLPSHPSINASLADADHVHQQHAALQSFHLPFTPLRGRKGYLQAHERQLQVMMMARTGSTIKRKIMQMRLFYLNKDLLDPG